MRKLHCKWCPLWSRDLEWQKEDWRWRRDFWKISFQQCSQANGIQQWKELWLDEKLKTKRKLKNTHLTLQSLLVWTKFFLLLFVWFRNFRISRFVNFVASEVVFHWISPICVLGFVLLFAWLVFAVVTHSEVFLTFLLADAEMLPDPCSESFWSFWELFVSHRVTHVPVSMEMLSMEISGQFPRKWWKRGKLCHFHLFHGNPFRKQA